MSVIMRRKRDNWRLISFICFGLIVNGLTAAKARGHHGGASAAFGPGSPVETTSPYTLGEGQFLTYARYAYVPFKTFKKSKYDPAVDGDPDASGTQPQTGQDTGNILRYQFYNLMLGYGITDAVSIYANIPYAEKTQEHWGTASGVGDVEFILQYGFKYGVRDGIKGWYANSKSDFKIMRDHNVDETRFLVFGSITAPNGNLTETDTEGNKFDMSMQAGWANPSINIGGSISQNFFDHWNLVADIQYRAFSQNSGPGTAKAGNEFRFNLAPVYQVYENPGGFLTRVDVMGEANYLHLERDQGDNGDGSGTLREELDETGGDILYLSPAIRVSFNQLSIGAIIKFPTLKDLNEQETQQGAEGLEKYRIAVTASLAF